MSVLESPTVPDGALESSAQARDATFPVPLNEEARLSALQGLDILDTPPDERFDRIARLAAAHFRVPMARITFVDRDRTWYKACVGAKAFESPREIAICSHAVMSDQVLVSRDLSQDPRFRASPQVAGDPKLRFYAGAPITLKGGMRVGSLCIIDFEPRPHFSEDDSAFLADLAQIVVHELELHKQIANRDLSLTEAERRIEIAQDAKKRFMDIVGHELRTPLSHVLGFGKILAGQQLGPLGNESYADYAHCLFQSAERLEGLIGHVLTYCSAEAGELRLAESTFATDSLMARCLELVQLPGKTAGVAVRLSVHEDAPTWLFADEVQIAEVVVQMLDNAISFSPRGSTIELSVCCDQVGGPCIRVLDRGPGIDPDCIERVMHAFTQVDDSLSRGHEGIGLGLPIARAIVELHGGALRLANRAGGGTVVEASLPAHRNRS